MRDSVVGSPLNLRRVARVSTRYTRDDMREGWPSLTALAVAVARGIGTDAQSVDPSAAYLVPPPIGRVLAWLSRPTTPAAIRDALRVMSLGIVDHVSLRRAAIDHALFEAIEAGASQLVVLGAGLDGRAWRLPALAGTTVFEIDHPATQAGKRQRVATRTATADAVQFVPVDFEHDDLDTCLDRAGHEPGRPTVWIWEGVTPYLHPAAIEASLRVVAQRSAATSRLIVSYMTPQVVPWDNPPLQALTRASFSALGEPLRGALSTEQLTEDLAAHGFVVLGDSNNRRWARRHGGSARLATPLACERLAVAERVAHRH